MGSNGAGKSTLLRSLCGVYAADGGEIRIDGETPYENPRVKDQVVFVPDFPYYLPQANLRTMADLYTAGSTPAGAKTSFSGCAACSG